MNYNIVCIAICCSLSHPSLLHETVPMVNYGTRVAVITGGSRGVGYNTVEALCGKFSGDVLMTARDSIRGLQAIESLYEIGKKPKFHILDIADKKSVSEFRDFMVTWYGGIDIMINAASVSFTGKSDVTFEKKVLETIEVNYYAFKNTCKLLFPLLRPHARVVNIASSTAHSSEIPEEALRKKFYADNLTEQQLDNLISSFVILASNKSHRSFGWPADPFVVSKVAVAAYTRIQQRELLKNASEDIIVNSVNPGYCSSECDDVDAILYAALLPENATEPKGAFIWSDKQIVDWVNGPVPPTVVRKKLNQLN